MNCIPFFTNQFSGRVLDFFQDHQLVAWIKYLYGKAPKIMCRAKPGEGGLRHIHQIAHFVQMGLGNG